MKERIIEFLKAENKSSAQLAEEIGVQPSGISHIISGRNKPSLDFILKMLEKYRFISTDWLLFGKGSMYKEPEMQKLFEEAIDFTSKPSENEINIEHEDKQDKRIENKTQTITEKTGAIVEKIVWFYKDNSFKEYFPETE
ncbi:MAG: helix-turn-helix transcriptional regulator [Bacteroidia bacterium]|nr:helix-turn-helix transcriptional regulator [Bacteroidia bacterium]